MNTRVQVYSSGETKRVRDNERYTHRQRIKVDPLVVVVTVVLFFFLLLVILFFFLFLHWDRMYPDELRSVPVDDETATVDELGAPILIKVEPPDVLLRPLDASR